MSNAHPLSGKKVLIVEDQYLIADQIQRAVTALGGEAVGPCPTLQQARAALADTDVALALLDINLAGTMVFALVDELTAKGVAIIFASGYDEWIIPARYQSFGRLQKPISRGSLETAVTLATRQGLLTS